MCRSCHPPDSILIEIHLLRYAHLMQCRIIDPSGANCGVWFTRMRCAVSPGCARRRDRGGTGLARIFHHVATTTRDMSQSASFAPIGVLDVLSSTTPRPARSGRGPQCRPLRAPWPRIPGAATTAMFSIAEERQRRSRGHAAATLWADGGRGRSLRCSSSTMLGHRLPPRALTSAREPHRRAALVAPAGPLGRKRHISRHLAGLATRRGEKSGLWTRSR